MSGELKKRGTACTVESVQEVITANGFDSPLPCHVMWHKVEKIQIQMFLIIKLAVYTASFAVTVKTIYLFTSIML